MKKAKLYLTGGLGNQLFQLKFAQNLERIGLKVTLDTSTLKPRNLELPIELVEFKILHRSFSQPRLFHALVHRNLFPNVVFENNQNIFHLLLSKLIRLNHFGYYQSINGELDFPLKLGSFEESLLTKYDFAEELTHSLAIHIRGGDFKNNDKYVNLDAKYYVSILKNLDFGNSSTIFVFTDDTQHAKIVLNSVELQFDLNRYKIVFINQEISAFETLKLLSMAKTRILSNSTFAWWSGVLALNRGRIDTYVPRTFYTLKQMDIPIPDSWHIRSV